MKEEETMCPECIQTDVVPIFILLGNFVFQNQMMHCPMDPSLRSFPDHKTYPGRTLADSLTHGSRPMTHSVANWRVVVIQKRLAKCSGLGRSLS